MRNGELTSNVLDASHLSHLNQRFFKHLETPMIGRKDWQVNRCCRVESGFELVLVR